MRIYSKISLEKIRNMMPSVVSVARLVMASVFLYLIMNHQVLLSILIFIIAVGSDALDGYLARKLKAVSSWGGYLDIVADFILVIFSFTAFVLLGIYPSWVLILIVLMFSQFIITSRFKKPVYDPIGKYYGGFLFSIILLTLIFPNNELYLILSVLILIFTLISISSRIYFFLKQKSPDL